MEYLDIVDEQGMPTGEIIERSIAHAQGILHRTSHVWLFRHHHGTLEILLQKRSKDKDSFPGCYDISSAGHIPAGVDYVTSALRELKEEIGVDATEEDLYFCGQRRIHYEEVFHGQRFEDNQVTNVYMLFVHQEAKEFQIQESELEEVIWIEFSECVERVRKNTINHCIMEEELEILEKALQQYNFTNVPSDLS
jgi:isopentenyldiphosphate isomerase